MFLSRFCSALFALCAIALFPTTGTAAVIAGWDFNGLSGYGPSPFTATTVDPGVTVGGLTRGPGLDTGGTAAANAWGGRGATSADLNGAVSSGDFATFSITVNANNTLSLTSIEPYNVRRSGTGSTTGQWQYQIDSGSFVDIGSSITWGSTTTAGGNAQSSIDLSSIAALQNLAAATQVTFRLATWGASGAAGTWYLNNFQAGDDLIISGTVTPVGAPADLFWDTNGILPGSGNTGGDWSDTNWTTDPAGEATTGNFTDGSKAVFSAGTDGTGAFTVNLDTSPTVNGIHLQQGDVTIADGGGTLTLSSSTIQVDGPGSLTIGAPLAGTVGLTKSGSGELTLTNAGNSFSGGVNITEGALNVTADGQLGALANNVTIAGGARLGIQGDGFATSRSIGSGGTGTLALGLNPGSTQTFNGDISVDQLDISSPATINGSGSILVSGNVNFPILASHTSGTVTIANDIATAAGTRTIEVTHADAVLAFTGAFNKPGSGNFNKVGEGTLDLSGTTSVNFSRLALGTAGSVNGGTVRFSDGDQLGNNQIFFNWGTLEATAATTVPQGFSIGGRLGSEVALEGSDITVTGDSSTFGFNQDIALRVNNNTTFAGNQNFTSGDSLTIGGSGNAIFNTPVTASMPTIFTDTLTAEINSDWSGDITVGPMATLTGNGTIFGTATIEGTLSPGASPGLLTFDQLDLAVAANSLFELDGLDRGISYDAVDVLGQAAINGTITVTGSHQFAPGDIFQLFSWETVQPNSNPSFVFDTPLGVVWDTSNFLSDGTISVLVIPEPSRALLLALALAPILLRRRRGSA